MRALNASSFFAKLLFKFILRPLSSFPPSMMVSSGMRQKLLRQSDSGIFRTLLSQEFIVFKREREREREREGRRKKESVRMKRGCLLFRIPFYNYMIPREYRDTAEISRKQLCITFRLCISRDLFFRDAACIISICNIPRSLCAGRETRINLVFRIFKFRLKNCNTIGILAVLQFS